MWSILDYINTSANTFSNYTLYSTEGDVYIVVNTIGSPKKWDKVLNKTKEDSRLNLSTRGEWLNLYYKD